MFSPTEISRLLVTLAAKLDERGVVATITVAGGATMGYVYDARPSTRDVDALLRPRDAVLAAAAEVANDEGLPDGWLNDKFAMFWPHHGEPDLSRIERHGTVTIQYAGPRIMLAMKMLASVRGRRDADDLVHLIEPAGVMNVEEAIEIFEDFYRDHDIPPQALAVISAALQARS